MCLETKDGGRIRQERAQNKVIACPNHGRINRWQIGNVIDLKQIL